MPKTFPRVLHVGPLPPPVGGVALSLQAILRCPALQDFDNRVFNTSEGRLTEVVGRKGLTLERFVRRMKLILQLARHVRQMRPELVHFQCGSEGALDILGDLLMVWASCLAGGPVILHLHVDPATADLPGRNPFGQWLFRRLIRPVSAIFTLTEGYHEHLLSCSVRQLIRVAPNTCDETLLTLPVDRPRASETVRILFLGRLTRAKGIFDLLEVAARLHTEHPEIHFDIAGLPSTPDEERLIREFLERERLQETLTLVGLVTGPDKLKLFERGDILLAPSYWESFGIVAIEGMAAGLPVVAANVPGLKSIVVEGETGYLVEPGDVESLKQHLARLAKDKNLREQLGRAGRKRFLERYSLQRVGAVIAETYHQILEKETI